MDEDFQVAPLQIPEIEPESRFIHGIYYLIFFVY